MYSKVLLIEDLILLKMLRIGIEHSVKALKIHVVAAVPVCWLNNDVVHHEVTFDIRDLIFFYFWQWSLSKSGVPAGQIGTISRYPATVLASSSCILEQNLNFAHLEFCRGDLDRAWSIFIITCCLVCNSIRGLPRRLRSVAVAQIGTIGNNVATVSLSIKLISKLRFSLINLWTY